MKKILILLTLFAASPAVAASKADEKALAEGQAQLAKLTKGLVPGKPMTCIPDERWSGGTNIDRVGILYGSGSRLYLNSMPDCHFGPGDIPVIKSYGQTCRGDMVTVIESATRFPIDNCVLGDFIPYAKPTAK